MRLGSTGGTRQDWLDTLAAELAFWIAGHGYALPPFRVSEGFPSAGRRSRLLAESWHDRDSNTYAILIRPDQDDHVKLAAALAHELVRIAVGSADIRGYLFLHLASGIGLDGTRNGSRPGPAFRKRLGSVLQKLGPLPRSAGGRETVNPPKQSTRLIKVSCPECGYVARVARKWLNQMGAPHCPQHGSMQIEQPGESKGPP